MFGKMYYFFWSWIWFDYHLPGSKSLSPDQYFYTIVNHLQLRGLSGSGDAQK